VSVFTGIPKFHLLCMAVLAVLPVMLYGAVLSPLPPFRMFKYGYNIRGSEGEYLKCQSCGQPATVTDTDETSLHVLGTVHFYCCEKHRPDYLKNVLTWLSLAWFGCLVGAYRKKRLAAHW
jgi:hypothetical protein